jgi:excisionase family DNA binding protein
MYSTKEAAEILGLSQAHVKLLARKGVIEARKVARDWIILDLNYTRKRRSKEKRK